jgi:DNA polymerase III epsilon subunit-like protein
MDNDREHICFVDFETTGSNLFEDEPIQIGAFLASGSDDKSLSEFKSFIKPTKNIKNTQKAFRIHGISTKDLVNEPEPKQVLSNFFEKFGTNFCFGGWNISFDIPFFRKLCYENGYQKYYDDINYRHIDVQSVCRTLKYIDLVEPDLNSLSDFANYFGLERSKAHDALEDAKITHVVFLKALNLLKESNKKKADFTHLVNL